MAEISSAADCIWTRCGLGEKRGKWAAGVRARTQRGLYMDWRNRPYGLAVAVHWKSSSRAVGLLSEYINLFDPGNLFCFLLQNWKDSEMPSSIFKDHSNRKRVHDDKGKSPRHRIMKNPIELADIMHPRVEERESLPRPRRDSESFDFLSTNEEVNDSNLTLDFGELEVDHDCEGNGSNALISGRRGFQEFRKRNKEDL